MNRKILLIAILILALGFGSLPAYAAAPAGPPLPWEKVVVDSTPQLFFTRDVTAKYDPYTARLYVAYHDTNNADLKLAYEVEPGAGNCGNNHNFQCSTVDYLGNVGYQASMDIVRVFNSTLPMLSYTRIGIAYVDITNNAIKYAWKDITILDPYPAWNIITVLKSQTTKNITIGEARVVLKYDPTSGYPTIAFHWVLDDGRRTVIAMPYLGPGNGWLGPDQSFEYHAVAYGNDTNFGTNMDMEISYEGVTQIVYNDSDHPSIRAAQHPIGTATPCASDSAWGCTTLEVISNDTSSLAVHARQNAKDRFSVIYTTAGLANNKLRHIWYSGPGGNCVGNSAFTCEELSDGVNSNSIYNTIDLVVDKNNYEIITFQTYSVWGGGVTNNSLMMMRPALAVGRENCGPLFAGNRTWYCAEVDYGWKDATHDIIKGTYSSIATYPDGRIAVAYNRLDNSAVDKLQAVMVARQFYPAYMPLIRR